MSNTITVGIDPTGVAYNPINSNIYVTNEQDNSVSVIAPNGDINDTIAVGNGPNGIVYNPGNNNTYVVNKFDNSVSVIDSSNQVINSILVGSRKNFFLLPFLYVG